MKEPDPIMIATLKRLNPEANSSPARMGPIAAPPRPKPMTKPVPVARCCVGKEVAIKEKMPTCPALNINIAIPAAQLR